MRCSANEVVDGSKKLVMACICDVPEDIFRVFKPRTLDLQKHPYQAFDEEVGWRV